MRPPSAEARRKPPPSASLAPRTPVAARPPSSPKTADLAAAPTRPVAAPKTLAARAAPLKVFFSRWRRPLLHELELAVGANLKVDGILVDPVRVGSRVAL